MIVAERYAKALMQLATETGNTDAVRSDMKAVHTICSESHEFIRFLESPVIKTDKKVEVMTSIFKGKVSDLSLSFLLLITRKSREAIISHIAAAFENQYKSNRNILTAVITSAHGLDEVTRKKVLDLVKEQTKAEVDLIEKVDPSTIGGFVLRIGDRQIDRTVSRQLAEMKKTLVKVN
jgi:F-type H+-transporting ATPase subunit delta